jgi:antibiotic biosynthesis monooxygenase (ABM) superfamily enzyme
VNATPPRFPAAFVQDSGGFEPHDARPVTLITRLRIKRGCEPAFMVAVAAFAAFAGSFTGYLDLRVLRMKRDCVIVNRFDRASARGAFTASEPYRTWLRQLAALATSA